jgi:hypothetical protein
MESSAIQAPGYLINVVNTRKGVGGPWTHVDGFSETVLDYVRELEQAKLAIDARLLVELNYKTKRRRAFTLRRSF